MIVFPLGNDRIFKTIDQDLFRIEFYYNFLHCVFFMQLIGSDNLECFNLFFYGLLLALIYDLIFDFLAIRMLLNMSGFLFCGLMLY